MTETRADRRTKVAPSAQQSHGSFRSDIQGLRAVAVVTVVIYHLGVFGFQAGFVGVDVFFVISGYLITGQFYRSVAKGGRIRPVAFYASRIRRLVPAATLVLCTTAAFTLLFLPEPRWGDIAKDVVASTLNVENWRLASGATDYLSNTDTASPLQHFWSLAVEEQFYLVWPFLLIGGLHFSRIFSVLHGHGERKRPSFRGVIVGVSAVVLAFSLVLSIWYTAIDPAPAYFVTFTRLWEMAAGALAAALLKPGAKLPRFLGGTLAWTGLTVIVGSAALLSHSVAYPGVAATVPVLGAVLVIVGGVSDDSWGPGVILNLRPVQWIGNISYSLYLWHWPAIVLAIALLGPITLTTGILVAGTSFILSAASYLLVEDKFRNSLLLKESTRTTFIVGLALVGTSLIAAVLTLAFYNTARSRAFELDGQLPKAPGASVLLAGSRIETNPAFITPDPIIARQDGKYPCVTTPIRDSEITSCSFGDRNAAATIALVGDSHAQQWIPALDSIAKDHHLRLVAYIHDACPFAAGELLRGDGVGTRGTPYTPCINWNQKLQGELQSVTNLRLLVVSNYSDSAYRQSNPNLEVEAMATAMTDAWTPILNREIPVLAIRDTPKPGIDVPDCVAAHRQQIDKCSVPASVATQDRGSAQIRAVEQTAGASLLDLESSICTPQICPAVVGNVLVYRDSNHLTGSYVMTLRPSVERVLLRLLS